MDQGHLVGLVTGVLFLLASFFAAIREILLRKDPHYPTVTFLELSTLFVFAMSMFLVGAALVFDAVNAGPVIAPSFLVFVAVGAAMHKATSLARTLQLRLRPESWDRISRIIRTSRCTIFSWDHFRFLQRRRRDRLASSAPTPAVVVDPLTAMDMLESSGATVVRPLETPGEYAANRPDGLIRA